jgi:hypothetical protein
MAEKIKKVAKKKKKRLSKGMRKHIRRQKSDARKKVPEASNRV